MKKLKIVVLVLFISIMCGNQALLSGATEKKTVIISAASSLMDVMEEIKRAYEKNEKNTLLKFNFGSSGSLQLQIENGAPVDIFISAAKKQMDALEEKGLILKSSRKSVLSNKLVIVTRKGLENIKFYKDVTTQKVKRLGIGEPKSVPAGQYAVESLKSMKYYQTVFPKLIFAKDVREVLTWVVTGNIDAGIIYKSDALTSNKINIITYAPQNGYSPIIYPSAIIGKSKSINECKVFMKFLNSESAKKIFKKYGFAIPSK